MNVMTITDQDYTTRQNLYSLTIHISGESESRIAPFSTETIRVETKADDYIFSNCRDLHLEPVHGAGQIIDVIVDAGVFASDMSDAIQRMEQLQFLDVWGLGGVLQLTPPRITVLHADMIYDH